MNSMMQPALPAPSKSSAPMASPTRAGTAARCPRDPGVRQDHTQSFLSLRQSHAERRKKDMPSRLDWLLSIIDSRDVQQLPYFEAHGQAREATEVGQTCAHCNARVSSKSGYNADEYRPADRCMICLRWHCEQHCNFIVNLGFSTRDLKLTCCERCQRSVDVLRWHKDQLPDCLSETHRQMMIAHTQLAEHLTSLFTHVSQFDGLSRKLLEEWQTQGQDPALQQTFEALKEAMQQSRGNADAAEAAISACLVQLDDIQLQTANGRDLKLRQQLVRHTASQLQPLKLRLKTARARADQLHRNLSWRRG